MFDGNSGLRIEWKALQARLEQADVIVIGEQHDDHFGHLFQQALVDSVLAKYEGSAVSLEMLQRDEQSFVNDYVAGFLPQDQFLRRAPVGWTPGPSWMAWYQGNIESARIHGRRVIAANSPLRYIKVAKEGGYEALALIEGPSALNFSLPSGPSTGGYVERYREFFTAGHGEASEDGDEGGEPEMDAAELAASEAALEASFRCQSLWDATMAASIVEARASGSTKVVHLVGQFHSDFNGGLVQQLKLLSPELRVLVLSMQPSNAETLLEEDEERADVVVYTGYTN